MEDFKVVLYEANKSIKTADHLIYMTYPMIKDIKILASVIENINLALIKTMDAMLYYEKMYKRINFLPDDFQSRMDLFKRVADRYNIDREHIQLIKDIKYLIDLRRRSPMEFIRRDKFVISDDNFRLKTLNYEKIKEYLNSSKLFISKVNRILLQNGRIF
jgi:hypothetical protein